MSDIYLTYGKRQFVVDVVTGDRKRLSVTVHPNLRITAKAPAGYEPEVIRQRMEQRASWIARQLDFFERFQPLPPVRKFVSGETHYYLGRPVSMNPKNQFPQYSHIISLKLHICNFQFFYLTG